MVDGLAVVGKARRAIGHHALALGGAHGSTQVGLAALAEQALTALGGVQRNHVVTGLDAGHAFAHFHHNASALVAQHHREQALGVFTAQGEGVGVAHAGVGDLDQHFALLGRGDIDFHDLQGFSGLKGHGGAGFHGQVFLWKGSTWGGALCSHPER